jgi:alpha-L-fucosidase
VFSLPRSQQTTAAEYHALAATFDPPRYDPRAVARMAASAGMRYVVFTTRHHNGYAMFDTTTTNHNVANSPYRAPSGRDIVRETFDACRAEGLRTGIYYSLSDWHHPDYPAWTEAFRPYRLGISPPLPTEEQAGRFRQYLMEQLRELLTEYGDIGVVWFDGGWERPQEWWRPKEIEALIRSLQPDALINDRLFGVADFSTPEQFVPAVAPGGRWESCLTMNDSWGWNPDDTHYKSARAIINTLCETAGRGGNLLLNVSPRGDGTIPGEQTELLEAVAGWMATHADAIHGTEAGLEPWQFYGPSTRTGDDLVHLFVLMRPYETVTVRGLPVRRVRRVTVMGRGTELRFSHRTGIIEMLMDDPTGELIIDVPETELDEYVTVLTVEIDVAPTS